MVAEHYIVIESDHPDPKDDTCDYIPAFRTNSEIIYNYLKTIDDQITDDDRMGGIQEWKVSDVETNLKTLLINISDFLDFEVYLCHLSWMQTDEWEGYNAEDLLPHSKLWEDWRNR